MEKRLARGEIIGWNAKIVSSKNKANTGIEGKIIDETKNTLTLKTQKGKKRVIKKNIVISFKMKKNEITINGEKLQGAPEERIKIR